MTSGGRKREGLDRAGVSSTLAHRARGVRDDDPVLALCRSLDYFPTQLWASRAIGELIMRIDGAARSAWEPACGEAIMACGLADYFDRLVMSDVHDYGVGGRVLDFLEDDADAPGGPVDWIVSNPPFADGKAERFVQLARQRARRGVAMFVRLGFQETVGRYGLFHGPDAAAFVCPFSERVGIVLGDCQAGGGTAAAYMVVIWITDPELAAEFPGHGVMRPIEPGTRDRLTRASDKAFLDGLRASRRQRLLGVSA